MAIMTAPCKAEPRNPNGKAHCASKRKVEIEASMDGYPYTCVGKGFTTCSDSVELQHHQDATGTTACSQQVEQGMTTSDSTPSRSYANDHLCKTITAADSSIHSKACVEQVPPQIPEIEPTSTRVHDHSINHRRNDIPIDAKAMFAECDTRQAQRAPICNKHKPALARAVLTKVTSGKFLKRSAVDPPPVSGKPAALYPGSVGVGTI
ncbi:MAG: hypothetical protein WKG03_06310, partial [Telluria sp.]